MPDPSTPAAPTITAMMLVRDRADLLEAAMRSVLAQTERDLELVVFDDGSRDDSRAVAERVAARDARVRVLGVEAGASLGIPAARNRVVAAARGRYLAVCDSDDLSRPERFAAQRALLDTNARLAGVGARFSTFHGHAPRPTNSPAAAESLDHEPGWHWGLRDGRLPFLFPTAMLRLESVRAVDGFDPSYALAEDLHLCYRLAAAGGRFASVDAVLVDYRIHDGSITQSRARAREWHNLRAQLAGIALLRGRFSVRGWAVLAQSLARTLLASAGLRR